MQDSKLEEKKFKNNSQLMSEDLSKKFTKIETREADLAAKKDSLQINENKVSKLVMNQAKPANVTVKVNSLSELIEKLKQENAESEKEQNSAPTKATTSNKQLERTEHEKQETSPGDNAEPIARCPTPLLPGSYWYAKQFGTSPEKELPSTSTQEVRNVLAALTSKVPSKTSQESKLDDTEAEPPLKSEEISADESSETSQSYSTDTLTEGSDDKLKSGDKSGTLEDARSDAEVFEIQANSEVTIQSESAEINTRGTFEDITNITEVNLHEMNDETNADMQNVDEPNKGILENSNQLSSKNELDTNNVGDTDDNLTEISTNDFIQAEEDQIYVGEMDDQLTEISPNEFIKAEEDKKPAQHSSNECVSSECMCYEAIFRQDHPLETSSLKSDSSFGTDSPANSPRKQPHARHTSHSTGSQSDGSLHSPSRPSPRRCRIAAKFEQPLN